jgi:hypothetical protein
MIMNDLTAEFRDTAANNNSLQAYQAQAGELDSSFAWL